MSTVIPTNVRAEEHEPATEAAELRGLGGVSVGSASVAATLSEPLSATGTGEMASGNVFIGEPMQLKALSRFDFGTTQYAWVTEKDGRRQRGCVAALCGSLCKALQYDYSSSNCSGNCT